MDNEKRYNVLLEIYQKAYPDVLKQNQFKAAQREWNRVKNSPEDYEKLLLTQIRQLRYPGGLNQKRKVNNLTQTKGGLTRIDLHDTICMIRLI